MSSYIVPLLAIISRLAFKYSTGETNCMNGAGLVAACLMIELSFHDKYAGAAFPRNVLTILSIAPVALVAFGFATSAM